jgi:hypothetical protein
MSAPENVSFISRFTLKFVEIVAAGLATAASGYLIAHLSGVLSSPAPAPNAAVTTTANGNMASGQPPQPIAPTAAETTQERLLPQQEPEAARAAGPTRRIVNITKAQPADKHIEKAIRGAESARDQDSFADRVRAALAKADAKRADPLDSSLSGSFARQPAAIEQPRPLSDRSNPAAISAAPTAAPGLRPAPTPVEANPPAAVETTSRPVTATESSPASGKQTDVLSTLEQMLRHDPVANADEAPRPPMPVGQ